MEDYDYWSPGIKVASLKDFLEYLGEVISGHEDLYLEDRKKIRDIIHTFQTSDTTSRFIELIRRL